MNFRGVESEIPTPPRGEAYQTAQLNDKKRRLLKARARRPGVAIASSQKFKKNAARGFSTGIHRDLRALKAAGGAGRPRRDQPLKSGEKGQV